MNWEKLIKQEQKKPYYHELMIKIQNAAKPIYPPIDNWFTAFNLCSYKNLKVVFIGQDPYINENQAHGLAFSVLNGKTPPSLLNIKKELEKEYKIPINDNNNLSCWAIQGVLLLNRILTVSAKKANSHKNFGWEIFTKNIIQHINENHKNIVFLLLGNQAFEVEKWIDSTKHCVIKAPHPSPLSAYRGFFGSNIFIKTNEYLKKCNQETINWEIV